MNAEQLLDVIDTYLEQAVARPKVTADQAIRAVRDLEAEIARMQAEIAHLRALASRPAMGHGNEA